MTARDLIGIAASFAYAAGLLAVAELLQLAGGVRQHLTRKLVHVGAGMWVFGVLALFDSWQAGLIPYAAFIALNAVIYRRRLFRALEDEHNSPGTVYFALVATVLFGLLWRPHGPLDRAPAAVAGMMALTWGDALAALVGRAFGRHRYQVGRSRRSLEGSATMFVVSVLAIELTLAYLPGSPLSPFSLPYAPARALGAALTGALAGTLVEAVSPRGLDNLAIPIVVAATAILLA
jgi:phytol kinase